MTNNSPLLSDRCRPARIALVLAAIVVIPASPLCAQCFPQDDPESYTCQMQQQQQATPTEDTESRFSLQGLPQSQTPAAGQGQEPSASSSLSGGTGYSERGLPQEQTKNGRVPAGLVPPEPPTEFQRFVAADMGDLLPIYGAKLFATQTSNFGPLDNAPASPDMVIGADDELRVRIWGQLNVSADLRVSREGDIYLPKVGAVHVTGLRFAEVASHLRAAIDQVYRNYQLTVDVGEIHSIQIYVAGRARNPGEYTVSALSTLVNAVFASGGPAASGSMRHLELRREGRVTTDFDLYALLTKGDKTGDAALQSGDILYIPAAGPQVALLGSVREQAIFELRGRETVGELLDAAGGRTVLASGTRISIERIADNGTRRELNIVPGASGLDTVLADGDVVHVDAIIPSYRDTVTLRGSVANPGRFRWHPGMRLRELMPDRDSLLARDYWWRRAQLGFPEPEFSPSVEAISQSPGGDRAYSVNLQKGVHSSSPAEQQEWQLSSSGAPPSRPPGDRGNTTPMSSSEPMTRPELESGDERQPLVHRPDSETNWDYAVIERLDPSTMTTSLIPFDLGKLVLDQDPSQNLDLLPGDVVTVFSQDDIHLPLERQTQYVRLEGEFAHAGVYSVRPGETLRSLVARAGGLTSHAYLFGADFTRQSTQKLEQQRFDEFIDRLDNELARNSMSMVGLSGADGAAGVQQSQVENIDRILIAKLRQFHSNGRIVLNLNPQSEGDGALPDLPLEDGDRFVVPARPATVQVIGAVFDQDAFLYRSDARVSDYLRLAGGPTRDADTRQAFILRADGSVTSRSMDQSVFDSRLGRLRLNPGDTIVIPEKGIHLGAMRGFLNWAQLFSQVSLGAAVVAVLK
ncbi:MAG TPA: SLBB domain-containing protein [Terracidiphilus sp.]|nr:SLBB domain-containing protein [Terracidiphilus sp.]